MLNAVNAELMHNVFCVIRNHSLIPAKDMRKQGRKLVIEEPNVKQTHSNGEYVFRRILLSVICFGEIDAQFFFVKIRRNYGRFYGLYEVDTLLNTVWQYFAYFKRF